MTGRAPDWDARWSRSGSAETGGRRFYGAAPNNYLRATVAILGAPASALLLADGDGRNGQWLAALGAAVTAVDISTVATAQACEHDRAAGARVERITADLADWTPPEERRWDATALIYMHSASAIRRRAVELAARALTPGGWLLLEGFSKAQAERAGLGPDDPDRLYAVAELTPLLGGFTLLEALEGEAWLDEGPRHQGPARILRLLARKDG